MVFNGFPSFIHVFLTFFPFSQTKIVSHSFVLSFLFLSFHVFFLFLWWDWSMWAFAAERTHITTATPLSLHRSNSIFKENDSSLLSSKQCHSHLAGRRDKDELPKRQ